MALPIPEPDGDLPTTTGPWTTLVRASYKRRPPCQTGTAPSVRTQNWPPQRMVIIALAVSRLRPRSRPLLGRRSRCPATTSVKAVSTLLQMMMCRPLQRMGEVLFAGSSTSSSPLGSLWGLASWCRWPTVSQIRSWMLCQDTWHPSIPLQINHVPC